MIKIAAMKISPIVFITIWLISFSNPLSASTKSETIIIKTAIYCDHCKECESCGGKIQRDLSFDKGIQEVVLDEKLMTITVKYNSSKTNPEEIRKKISAYGYDADDIKADLDAVAKLDGCCLKKE
jgi:mercuric ion binding protein